MTERDLLDAGYKSNLIMRLSETKSCKKEYNRYPQLTDNGDLKATTKDDHLDNVKHGTIETSEARRPRDIYAKAP
ncbi:hypothetical protein ACLOJK_017788 [Asimina triloba]